MCMCYHDDEFIMVVDVYFLFQMSGSVTRSLLSTCQNSVPTLWRNYVSWGPPGYSRKSVSELQLSKSSVIRTPKILIFI